MALSSSLIQFFVNRIGNSDLHTFRSEVKQLMDHIHSEAKDNPIYDKYQALLSHWTSYIQGLGRGRWMIPDNYDDSKALAYALYELVGQQEAEASGIAHKLFSSTNANESISRLNRTFLSYLAKALDEIIEANPEKEISESKRREIGKTVFIVHGHDVGLKAEVQLLLSRAGINNIVLHEQLDKGRTVIDKLIQEGSDAGYAIALLTPDDSQLDGGKRARQNVVLELGYFMGRLGKERVRMLLKGGIEMPTDLSGVLYERYDEHGAWKIKLLKEIMAVGIYVDITAAVEKI